MARIDDDAVRLAASCEKAACGTIRKAAQKIEHGQAVLHVQVLRFARANRVVQFSRLLPLPFGHQTIGGNQRGVACRFAGGAPLIDPCELIGRRFPPAGILVFLQDPPRIVAGARVVEQRVQVAASKQKLGQDPRGIRRRGVDAAGQQRDGVSKSPTLLELSCLREQRPVIAWRGPRSSCPRGSSQLRRHTVEAARR
jgi:hypothetical protein